MCHKWSGGVGWVSSYKVMGWMETLDTPGRLCDSELPPLASPWSQHTWRQDRAHPLRNTSTKMRVGQGEGGRGALHTHNWEAVLGAPEQRWRVYEESSPTAYRQVGGTRVIDQRGSQSQVQMHVLRGPSIARRELRHIVLPDMTHRIAQVKECRMKPTHTCAKTHQTKTCTHAHTHKHKHTHTHTHTKTKSNMQPQKQNQTCSPKNKIKHAAPKNKICNPENNMHTININTTRISPRNPETHTNKLDKWDKPQNTQTLKQARMSATVSSRSQPPSSTSSTNQGCIHCCGDCTIFLAASRKRASRATPIEGVSFAETPSMVDAACWVYPWRAYQ